MNPTNNSAEINRLDQNPGKTVKYNPTLEYLKDKLPSLLAKLGFLASIIIYIFNPSNLNLVVILIYIISYLVNVLLIHKKSFGIVYDRLTHQVIPNAQISIVSATLGNTLGMTQTDARGKYYVLLPYGDYQIKTKVSTGDKTVESEVKKITKSHCVVDFDIAI